MIKHYCAICDIELNEAELLDNCCPYCETEIPEIPEGIKKGLEDYRQGKMKPWKEVKKELGYD